MNVLILAAGFGTRMGELTKKTAKPLLPVGNRPVMSHLAEKLFATGMIEKLYVVSNEYYIDQFQDWAADFGKREVVVLNDGVVSNETRLGAIGDLKFLLDNVEIDGPLMVMAGDNLFEFDFSDIIHYYNNRECDVIASYRQPSVEKLKRTGVVKLNKSGQVSHFQEKPEKPESDLAVPCLYIFSAETLELVDRYLDSGENPDAPGHFVSWLYTRRPVYAFCFESKLYDIGNAESYEKTKREFQGN